MIAIICAMEEEFIQVVNLMKNVQFKTLSYFKIATGNIKNKNCIVALCGVGKVHAAICTQSLIMKYNPKLTLNVGVAGGIDKKLNIGDAVIASGLIQHDFDISAFSNRQKGEISGINCIEIKSTEWVSSQLLKCLNEFKSIKSHQGIILTGDQFINSKGKLRKLKKEFGGLACDMEAGSIAQVCYLNKIDFGILRTISDNADDNSHIDFESFLKKSSENAAILIEKFISSTPD